MAKRQHSVSLSFVVFRFAIVMLSSMVLCCLVWLSAMTLLQNIGIIYPGYIANQQAEQMLVGDPQIFISPSDDFLPEYALFNREGKVLESNVVGRKLESLTRFLQEGTYDMRVLNYSYVDGSTIIIRWHYRKEFANQVLRSGLPPFEYIWWGTLGIALVLCLLFNTLWLRRCLAVKLKLFSEVSRKVGAQELDFKIPHAGIWEYDQALGAMDDMREALYISLSSQWAAQQEREAEIAALAHDLKTPLTLIGGNAELLMEENISKNSFKMVKTILESNNRAKQYVTSLLETSVGEDEGFEPISLSAMFDELCQNVRVIAETNGVHLQFKNNLKGIANIQKTHLIRALGNVVQNAIEHTLVGGNVYLEGSMEESGWQVTVLDEGPGFSKAALHHATERLWRGDAARGADGHNGLGLWFAAQVVKTHSGQLKLNNCSSGGIVTIKFKIG